MEIINRKINELTPYARNPRKNDGAVEYVANSIREFGFKVPIVISADGEIIAGHTRLKAAKKLGMKELPCIVADDLTDEQVKAFRLADNKVGEAVEWDFDLLNEELDDIVNIDMDDFRFELPDYESDKLESVNERERTNSAYNLREYDELNTEGFYQMPVITGVKHTPKDLEGFNYLLTTAKKENGIHFYIDDYQFERIWQQPQMYLDKIAAFDCMLTPDFSLYVEMPIAMKIWNTYRSRLIGQMAQKMGITVIPTVSWCEEETFEFCFDGLPKNATLSISTIGVKKHEYNFGIWKAGCDEMIRRLKPETLLVYGGEVEYDYGDTNVVYYDNKVIRRMRTE